MATTAALQQQTSATNAATAASESLIGVGANTATMFRGLKVGAVGASEGMTAISKVGTLAPLEQGIARLGRFENTVRQGTMAFAPLIFIIGVAAVALAGIGLNAAKAAIDYETAMDVVADNAHLAKAAQQELSEAVAKAAIGTTSTSTDMILALGPVAGELARIQGNELKTADTVKTLTAAQNLHESASISLGAALKSLTDITLVYGGTAEDAAGYADILFQAQAQLGISANSVAASIQRLAPRLVGSGLDLQHMLAVVRLITPTVGTGQRALMQFGNVMQSLINPSNAATAAMLRYGISLVDQNGKFVGVAAAVDKLHAAYQNLHSPIQKTQFLTELFGRQQQIAKVLIEGGSKAIEDNAAALAKTGTAADAAALKAEAVSKRWEATSAAMGTATASLGAALLPVLTSVVDALNVVIMAAAQLIAANPQIATLVLVVTALAMAYKLAALVGLTSFVGGLVKAAIQIPLNILGMIALAGATDGLVVSEGAATTASVGLTAALKAQGAAALAAYGPLAAFAAISLPALTTPQIEDPQNGEDTMFGPRGPLNFLAKGYDSLFGTSYGGTKMQDDAAKAGESTGNAWLDAFIKSQEDAAAVAEQAAKPVIDVLGSTLEDVALAAETQGGKMMEELASGIASSQDVPLNALKALHGMLKNQLSTTAEVARLMGELTNADLAAGLASSDPKVLAQAEATNSYILERLDKLTDGAYTAGVKAKQALGDGWYRTRMAQGDTPSELHAEVAAIEQLAQTFDERYAPSAAEAAAGTKAVTDALAELDAKGGAAAEDFVAIFGTAMDGVIAASGLLGAEQMASYAQGLESARALPIQSLAGLHDLMNKAMTKEREMAFLLAALSGADIAAGLASADPVVRGKADAVVKIITDRLDALTEGAYSAGSNAGKNFAAGFTKGSVGDLSGHAGYVASAQAQILKNTWASMTPDVADLAAGVEDYDKWLKSLEKSAGAARSGIDSLAADAKDRLSAAFDAAKQAAHAFFDSVHEKNLRAIDDVEQAIRGTVNEARAQVEAQRALRREAELRAAVAAAATPEDQLRAQQALDDFLADQRLQRMDESATAAIAELDGQRTAENDRYKEQVTAYDKELAALQKHLARHPEEWRKSQEQVIKLLGKFGVDYETAGGELGQKFADGLAAKAKEVEDAAKALAKAGTKAPATTKDPFAGYPFAGYAVGAYNIAKDHLAMVHQGEMIIPAMDAAAIRSSSSGFEDLVRPVSSSSDGGASTPGGGGTLVLQFGDEVLARIIDKRLAVTEDLIRIQVPG